MAVFVCPGKITEIGTSLGNLDGGSIIALNESSSPVDFYVAKQDYESGLNGAGRTLPATVKPSDSQII